MDTAQQCKLPHARRSRARRREPAFCLTVPLLRKCIASCEEEVEGRVLSLLSLARCLRCAWFLAPPFLRFVCLFNSPRLPSSIFSQKKQTKSSPFPFLLNPNCLSYLLVKFSYNSSLSTAFLNRGPPRRTLEKRSSPLRALPCAGREVEEVSSETGKFDLTSNGGFVVLWSFVSSQ